MTEQRMRQPRTPRDRSRADARSSTPPSRSSAARDTTNGTLADIADQVGMTHAGVLHHFGSKDQLLLEVLAYRDETDVADLEEQHIPGGHRPVPPPRAHRLRATQRAARHRAGLHRALGRVRDRRPSRPRLLPRTRYRRCAARSTERFRRAVRRARRRPSPTRSPRLGQHPRRHGRAAGAVAARPHRRSISPRASQFAIEAIVAAVLDPQPSAVE